MFVTRRLVTRGSSTRRSRRRGRAATSLGVEVRWRHDVGGGGRPQRLVRPGRAHRRAPSSIVPPAVEAQRVVAGGRRRVPELVGGPRAAPPGGEPLVHLDGTGLGEHVDHGMPVRAERQPGTGVTQRDARADAVGEVGLGGRAEADERPRRRRGCGRRRR